MKNLFRRVLAILVSFIALLISLYLEYPPKISSAPSPVKTTLCFCDMFLQSSYRRTQPKWVVGLSRLSIVFSKLSANFLSQKKYLHGLLDIFY